MSIRAQREQIKKLSVKDRKLSRLLFSKAVEDKDIYYLNYLYEERQNLTFGYSIAGSFLAALGMNFTFFRMNTFGYQMFFVGGMSLLGHIYVKRKIDQRFNDRINPYFEKYEIK